MSATLQDLKYAAVDLSAGDRAELAQFLIRSLDEGKETDAREEWLDLAKKRMDEIKTGGVVGRPADEVLRTLLDPRP